MPGGGWVATHEDITERKQAQARIEYLAHHDPLTDLPNRAAFNDFLAKAIERAAEQHEKIAVVCIDLDRFKELNDVFGHAVGDGLLRESLHATEGCGGGRVPGAVWGAMNSAWCDRRARNRRPPSRLAARLLAAAATDIEVDGHPLRIGLSIGVAIYPTDGADASALLANADAGLYRAKREGRGSVRFFEAQMDQRLRERRALQHELGSAIEHDEVRLYYQPQASIDGDDHRIRGTGALAAPDARHDSSRRVHFTCRRQRRHRSDRRMGPAGGVPASCVLGSPASCRDQSVPGAVSPWRPAQPGPRDPVGNRTCARDAWSWKSPKAC